MFVIYGKKYIIDFDAVEKHSLIYETITQGDSSLSRNKVNTIKAELIASLINKVVFSEAMDEKLGFNASGGSVGFNLAFNTLLSYNILRSYE